MEALAAIDTIKLGGVTNMSAGIFKAIEQFNVAFAKRSGSLGRLQPLCALSCLSFINYILPMDSL